MTYERPHLRALAGYVPGLQPRASAVKLNTNYPPSASVGAKLASISADILQRYPDPLAQQFRADAARNLADLDIRVLPPITEEIDHELHCRPPESY
jgi:histidinol-phosphate/aromatic aminotransferase/cobyric acid decarboxylase-like protein